MPPRIPLRLRPGAAGPSAPTQMFKASLASQSAPRHSDAASILSVGQPTPAAGTGPGARPSIEAQAAAIREATFARRVAATATTAEYSAKVQQVAQDKKNAGYMRMMTRRWSEGDVYAPHDLSAAEMRKGKKSRRGADVVDLYGIKPMDMYRNFNFLAHFMTPGGQIQHSNLTQLRPVNQRKVAKAIRRAIGLGLMPSVHRHPEILKWEFDMESNHRAFQILQKTRIAF